ncbi:MAG: hypothetical protein JXR36_13785 [Bacteroidales bacterium]|nr:hypothetical protein [Bacteroidales bacterium]
MKNKMNNKFLLLTFISAITLAFSSCEKYNEPVESMPIYTGTFEYKDSGFNDDGIPYLNQHVEYCGRFTHSESPVDTPYYVYFQKGYIPKKFRENNKTFSVEIQYEYLIYNFDASISGTKLYYINEIK